MRPDQIDLARRLVACRGWRWMPGMSARRWSGHGEVSAVARVSAPARETPWLSEGWLPDLTDPATLGCILALVREAWRCPTAYVRQSTSRRVSDGAFAWEVCDLWLDAEACRALGVDREGTVGSWGHGSEAEALVAALEAAP